MFVGYPKRAFKSKNNINHKENGGGKNVPKDILDNQKEKFSKLRNIFKDRCKSFKKGNHDVGCGKIQEKFVPNNKKSNIGFLTFPVSKRKKKINLNLFLHANDIGIPDRVNYEINFFNHYGKEDRKKCMKGVVDINPDGSNTDSIIFIVFELMYNGLDFLLPKKSIINY